MLDHFEQIVPGQLSAAEYDAFVRDTVNFLDYVSEPTQTARRALGVWVVLFLLVFTWLAWLGEARLLERRALIAARARTAPRHAGGG